MLVEALLPVCPNPQTSSISVVYFCALSLPLIKRRILMLHLVPIPTVGLRAAWAQKIQSALPSMSPAITIFLKEKKKKGKNVGLKLISNLSQHVHQIPKKELSVSSLPQVVPYPRVWLAPCKRKLQGQVRPLSEARSAVLLLPGEASLLQHDLGRTI